MDQLVESDEDFIQLTDGNMLLIDALAVALPQVRHTSFASVLDGLQERDEGFPLSAEPMWLTTVDQLKYVHDRHGSVKPEPFAAPAGRATLLMGQADAFTADRTATSTATSSAVGNRCEPSWPSVDLHRPFSSMSRQRPSRRGRFP